MGWFKMTGTNPSLNSTTPAPNDRFNAIGLAGVLSGNSDGHGVRALLELINVNGELRLVALGRRIDEGASQTFAASQDWQRMLPQGQWVHLAATFDYTTGEMALYKNGQPLDGFYTTAATRGRSTAPAPPNPPAGHQDRRLVPPGQPRAQPVQLPDGHADVPRHRRHGPGGEPAVRPLPLRPLAALGGGPVVS